MRGFFGIAVVCWLGAFFAPAAAYADESAMLYIRARSQLQLRESRRVQSKDGFRVTIDIQMTDNLPPVISGAGPEPSGAVPTAPQEVARSFHSQPIDLRLYSDASELASARVFTSEVGAASQRFIGLPIGRYRIVASYAGDEQRDGCTAELALDLDRRPVELTLEAPPTLPLREALPIFVQLRSAGEPLAGFIELGLGDGLRKKISVEKDGKTEKLKLPGAPPPGTVLTILATFAGDDENAAASARRELIITSQAQVTLEVAAGRQSAPGVEPLELLQNGRVVFSGTAFDEAGPLRGEPVDIEASESTEGAARRLLGSAVSDSYGRYTIAIAKLPLRVGAAFLSAQVSPSRRHIRPGHSPELSVAVQPPEPVSVLYFLVPLLLSFGGLLGFFAVRGLASFARLTLIPELAALWQRLRARSAPATPAESPLRRTSPSLSAPGVAGVTLGARTPTLRRTLDTTIEGVVHDAVFGPALRGATIRLILSSSGEIVGEETTDREGRFVFASAPAGRYIIVVQAAGYKSQEFSGSVPHKGELRGLMVRLLPLRVQLFDEWQRVAAMFGGVKVQVKTPAELLREAEARRISPVELARLRKLTALVEEGYYSRTLCDERMLAEATQLMRVLTQPNSTELAAAAKPVEIRAPGAPRPLD